MNLILFRFDANSYFSDVFLWKAVEAVNGKLVKPANSCHQDWDIRSGFVFSARDTSFSYHCSLIEQIFTRALVANR